MILDLVSLRVHPKQSILRLPRRHTFFMQKGVTPRNDRDN